MAVLRATNQTGVYMIEGLGTEIRLLEWRAGSFYDTVCFTAGAQSPGANQYLFQNLQGKNRQWTNLDNNAGRLPALNELIVNRIGAHIVQSIANVVVSDADIIKFAHAAYMRVSVNQTRIVFDAPIFTAQSGFGISGSTTRNNTGVVTTGVPSAAAAPQLLVAQPIGPNDSIGSDSYIVMYANSWLVPFGFGGPAVGGFSTAETMPEFETPIATTVFLDGLVKKPATA